MAVLKCKMCGGDLVIEPGMTVCECEYCGSKQTVPTVDNEKKLNLFARANRLRAACEFDKAFGVYESIVTEFMEEAEAYWGLVLCKYGIEYVDDPKTGKKIPTCHRSSFDSVMEDPNFEMVMEYSDVASRSVYREEAKTIEGLRTKIIEISSKEEPYDIFICYKETNETGGRTIDSVIAQDVYDALTERGYKVFFSRITLEDKLGQEYEPYIFAALNSAKIMLAFGTDYEYYNAVWVKNEWSRFLSLIERGEKKTLIPCYKDIDAYDMPAEFKRLQAQDMGKVGAIQDLLRGIGKVIGTKESSPSGNMHAGAASADGSALVQRGNMALEDGDFKNAEGFFERVLDANPSDARAYLGKFLALHSLTSLADLGDKVCRLDDDKEFKRAEQFADPSLAKELKAVKESNALKIERLRLIDAVRKFFAREKRKADVYKSACGKMEQAGDSAEYLAAAELFSSIPDYLDSGEKKEACLSKAKELAQQSSAHLNSMRERSKKAAPLIAAGRYHIVGLRTDGTVVAAGENKYGQCNVSDWKHIVAVAVGRYHTVGLRADGTAVAVGSGKEGCNVSDWKDIVAIATGDAHTVGLRADGTVVAAGDNLNEECNVSDWKNIIAVAAGNDHTVGLRADGTVVAVGDNRIGQCNVSDWKNIVAIAVGYDHTVGLREDGSVVAVGENNRGECRVSYWKDIVAISADDCHTVGLRADGRAIVCGSNGNTLLNQKCNVSDWNDIVDVVAGGFHVVGLCADGTVVATDCNSDGQCNVSGWQDIVAIAAGDSCTLGMRADGTVVAAGLKKDINWKLFDNIDNLEEERRRAKEEGIRRLEEERRRIEEKKAELESTKAALQAELANLKGLFSGKRRREIEAQLANIENELKQL
ncbi:MAG: TIR domain-containing protein [Oscillospiraceae bacterium]|nr:TIR domain-containing protein [Oscillospiraceae bacterium]